MKKLKIAMLASNYIRIPPSPKHVSQGSAGAVEFIISEITEELTRRGHRVTLFASGNSQTRAKLFSVYKKDSRSEEKIGRFRRREFEHLLISQAYQLARKGKFDIIHSHFDTRTCGYAPFVKTPTVSTLHSPLDSFIIKNILKFYKNTQYYTPISNSQKKLFKGLNYTATVHHGINLKKINPSFKKGKYFVASGRMVESKGALDAIKAIMKTDEKLLLIGKARSSLTEYWKKIEPYIDGKKIIHLGFIPRKKLLSYFKNAKALLFPIHWEEPFGLVMIEAMACGTPIIAFKRGSVPEVVKHNKTGFVVQPFNKNKKPNIEGLVEAIKKIDLIDRQECRRHTEENFSLERMVDDYEKVYYKILNRRSNR